MKYRVIFCPDLNLDIEVLYGDIGLEDLESMVRDEVNHPLFKSEADVITDMRRAQFKLSTQELNQWVDILATYDSIREKKKVGLLTSKPDHVVASTLLQHSISDLRYPQQMQIFSSVDPMLFWMSKKMFEDTYQQIIQDPGSAGYEFVED